HATPLRLSPTRQVDARRAILFGFHWSGGLFVTLGGSLMTPRTPIHTVCGSVFLFGPRGAAISPRGGADRPCQRDASLGLSCLFDDGLEPLNADLHHSGDLDGPPLRASPPRVNTDVDWGRPRTRSCCGSSRCCSSRRRRPPRL